MCTLTQRNRFFDGDSVEIMQPNKPFFVQKIDGMYGADGGRLEVANHAEMTVSFKTDFAVCPGAMVRKEVILKKN